MKDLVNNIISKVHWLMLAYAAYSGFILWDDHNLKMKELTDQFAPVEAEIQINQKKVKEIQEFVKKAEESKTRVEEAAKNIEDAQRKLPAEINDNQILTFINAEISTLNIKDPNIVPGTENTNNYFISKPYTMKARGTYLQFLVFFERIGNADRIYNVKSLKLTNSDKDQKGRFQLVTGDAVIEAFRYNPSFKVDRGFDPPAPTKP